MCLEDSICYDNHAILICILDQITEEILNIFETFDITNTK